MINDNIFILGGSNPLNADFFNKVQEDLVLIIN